jgi:CheY-like chemotaxis protein
MKGSPMILLVDDNVFNLIAIETILNHKYHLSVEKAMNGQQAFDMVH